MSNKRSFLATLAAIAWSFVGLRRKKDFETLINNPDRVARLMSEAGSVVTAQGPRCSLRTRRLYSDATVSYGKLLLLNVPAALLVLAGLFLVGIALWRGTMAHRQGWLLAWGAVGMVLGAFATLVGEIPPGPIPPAVLSMLCTALVFLSGYCVASGQSVYAGTYAWLLAVLSLVVVVMITNSSPSSPLPPSPLATSCQPNVPTIMFTLTCKI